MSRQFNFMPSRYVTPGHADESRGERDTSETRCGQDADEVRTAGGVPRDNDGKEAAVTRDQRASNALVTPDDIVTDGVKAWPSMTLDDVKERAHKEGRRYLGIPTAQEAARLAGRHGHTWWEATAYMHMKHLTAREVASIRAAFDEGVDLRHRKVRCFCNQCINPPRIVEDERRRGLYAQRRRDELTAEGFAPAEVEKRILEEIDKGMAL